MEIWFIRRFEKLEIVLLENYKNESNKDFVLNIILKKI